jgi:hypothetical protein
MGEAEKGEAARLEQQAKKETRLKEVMSELQASHNADADWSKTRFWWTADLQERLVRADGRSIVGSARLSDVERWGSGYRIHLVPKTVALDPRIEFFLTCSHLDKPTGPEPSTAAFLSTVVRSIRSPVYAFVARVHTVRRSDVRESGIEDMPKWEAVPRWVAEGECLALRALESSEPVDSPATNPKPAERKSKKSVSPF